MKPNKYDVVKWSEVLKESETGCVLRVASLLEFALRCVYERKIESYLKEKPSEKVLEVIFGYRGPLHELGRKIEIGKEFGILTPKECDALNAVRHIRNEAAHCQYNFELSRPKCKDHLETLQKHYGDEDYIVILTKWVHENVPERTTRFNFMAQCLKLYTDILVKLP